MKRREFLRLGAGGVMAAGCGLFWRCASDLPSEVEQSTDINIYLLKDASLTFEDVLRHDIATLSLERDPWISKDDIQFFDLSSSILYLNRSTIGLVPDVHLEQVPDGGIPFVISVGKQTCALGGLTPSNSAWGTPGFIRIDLPLRYASDVLYLTNFSGLPLECHQLLINAFESMGALHLGVQFTMEEIVVDTGENESKVQITFNVQNIDSDDLYVADPLYLEDTMSNNITQGPVFWGGLRNYQLKHLNDIPVLNDTWYDEWMIRMPAGTSLSRTISIAGYPPIPAGVYECYMVYPAPHMIERQNRYRPDGRVWLGSPRSSIYSSVKVPLGEQTNHD